MKDKNCTIHFSNNFVQMHYNENQV